MFSKLIRIKIYNIIVFAAILITGLNLTAVYMYLPGPLTEKKILIIKKGQSNIQIANQLAENEIIRFPWLFSTISKLYSFKSALKSGEYEFTYGVSPIQVIRKLASGKSIIHKLVIPEGLMVSEVIEKINSEPLLEGNISEVIPEGYLFPSTYFYSYGDKRQKIIDEMRKKMSAALDDVMSKLPADSLLKTRKDVLIMASIIEKEAGDDSEKRKISSIFANRLKKEIKLQSDPTTIYAITEGKYKLNRPLSKNDLKIESPYNTYFIKGLPPTAIACPGKKSLEAAVLPEKTNFLYFVVNRQGGHHFSQTLDEHNQHVQNYRARKEN